MFLLLTPPTQIYMIALIPRLSPSLIHYQIVQGTKPGTEMKTHFITSDVSLDKQMWRVTAIMTVWLWEWRWYKTAEAGSLNIKTVCCSSYLTFNKLNCILISWRYEKKTSLYIISFLWSPTFVCCLFEMLIRKKNVWVEISFRIFSIIKGEEFYEFGSQLRLCFFALWWTVIWSGHRKVHKVLDLQDLTIQPPVSPLF